MAPDPMLRVFDVTGGNRHSEITLSLVTSNTQATIVQMPWPPDGAWIPHIAPTSDPKRGVVKVWSARRAGKGMSDNPG